MRKVAAKDNDFSDYPLFKWVHDLNGGPTAIYSNGAKNIWYLPAEREVEQIYNNRSKFTSKRDFKNFYRTSTETNINRSRLSRMSLSGTSVNEYKDKERWGLAVLQF